MARGDQKVAARAAPTPELVAGRLERRLKALPEADIPEGVQPLNPGFFLLERMRTQPGARAKQARKTKLKGAR